MRIDSQDAIATGWTGAQDEGRLPTRRATAAAEATAVDAPDHTTPSRSWWRTVLRVARDTVIGLSMIIAVPIALIAVNGTSLWRQSDLVRERLAGVAQWRPLMSPTDATVTPMQAGDALHAIQMPPSRVEYTNFPMRPAVANYDRPWEHRATNIGMFPASSSIGLDAIVALQVVTHASGGFSPQELAYLRTVADAPIWQAVDLVASAKQVDIIGGALALPFRDDAFAAAMPVARFAWLKSTAYAGVSRAAYCVAIGQPDRAESALRAVVSLGFVFIDNGTSAIDAVVGRVVAAIGRDGLHQLYEITGDARGMARTAPLPKIDAQTFAEQQRLHLSSTEVMRTAQARLLADVTDPNVPRALRYDALRQLSYSPCGSVKELLFGPRDQVRDALDQASTTLARFPSELAYLDLVRDATNRVPMVSVNVQMQARPPELLLLGAATVASTVLHNPRIVLCTLMTQLRE